MDIDAIVTEVAAAVALAEGESGVRDVLRVIARSEPVATSQVSRMAELPVPIVTAVCNELRKRGVVDRTRPVALTAAARELLAAGGSHLVADCPTCGGLGLVIPADLKALADELEPAAAGAPQARMDLDQTHCTVATKLHRVLKLHDVGALDGKDIILIGDDDLVSVAIARFAALTGAAAIRTLAVVDTDPAVLAWIGEQAAGTGVPVTLVEHDLRQPLPAALTGAFDVACTDPPYTVPGAELFLSRAVAALRERPGGHVFFSFGARRPAETLATQRLITDLGLVTRSLTPNFNSYLGAGILAGSSHLYHLRSTDQTTPLVTGEYDGPLYTADTRTEQTRPYRCAACGEVYVVGAGARWATIADLKAAGCPGCGGTTFRPMPRSPRAPHQAAT
jgi:N4-bis(aminopropyl)spermidine synthase